MSLVSVPGSEAGDRLLRVSVGDLFEELAGMPRVGQPRVRQAGESLTHPDNRASRSLEREIRLQWKALTREQRVAWNEFATFHAPATPATGQELFRAAQLERHAMGMVMTYEAPTLAPPFAPADLEWVDSIAAPGFGVRVFHQLPSVAGIKMRIDLKQPGANFPETAIYADAWRSGDVVAIGCLAGRVPGTSPSVLHVSFVTVEGVKGPVMVREISPMRRVARSCGTHVDEAA